MGARAYRRRRATHLNYEISVHVQLGRRLELVRLARRVLETAVGCLKMLLLLLLAELVQSVLARGRQGPLAAAAGARQGGWGGRGVERCVGLVSIDRRALNGSSSAGAMRLCKANMIAIDHPRLRPAELSQVDHERPAR